MPLNVAGGNGRIRRTPTRPAGRIISQAAVLVNALCRWFSTRAAVLTVCEEGNSADTQPCCQAQFASTAANDGFPAMLRHLYVHFARASATHLRMVAASGGRTRRGCPVRHQHTGRMGLLENFEQLWCIGASQGEALVPDWIC